MTPRQQQVYEEVCKGKCNKEIARTLGVSDATVKMHMTEILREHGVRTRGELLAGQERPEGVKLLRGRELTDEEILREFVSTTFNTLGDDWPNRILKFGRAVLDRDHDASHGPGVR